jgi:hypothetical protein
MLKADLKLFSEEIGTELVCYFKKRTHISHIVVFSVILIGQRYALPSMASLTLTYFPTLSHKGTIFGKKVIENKICSDFLYTLSEKFLILKRFQ